MSADDATPSRRRFLANVAGSTAAITVAGLSARALLAQGTPAPPPQGGWDMSWVDRVSRAKHRQVFDGPDMAEGTALNNALLWLRGYNEIYRTADADMAAVLVFRHDGIPLVLNDGMWARLKIGAANKLKDPSSGAMALRNPFLNAKAGDTFSNIFPDGGLDTLISRGAIVLCCNLALTRMAGSLVKAEGISKEQAQTALIDALVPGVVRMPSGVFATTRAEEAGCNFLRAT